GLGEAVLAQVAGPEPPEPCADAIEQTRRRDGREREPEQLNGDDAEQVARDDRRWRPDRASDKGRALLRQVGCDLGAAVPDADNENALSAKVVARAVISRVDDAAAEGFDPLPVWNLLLVVMAGGNHDHVREPVAAVGLDQPPAVLRPHPRDPAAEPYVEAEMVGVLLEVSGEHVLRHVAWIRSRDRVVREPGEAPDRMQVQTVVPARPRSPDLLVLVEQDRLQPDVFQSGARREARGAGADDRHSGLSRRHGSFPARRGTKRAPSGRRLGSRRRTSAAPGGASFGGDNEPASRPRRCTRSIARLGPS